jgi:hypothetical protein
MQRLAQSLITLRRSLYTKQDIEIKKSLFELNSMMNVQWRATLSSNGDFAP